MLSEGHGWERAEIRLYYDYNRLYEGRLLCHYNVTSGDRVFVRRQLRLCVTAYVDGICCLVEDVFMDASITIAEATARIGREHGIEYGTAFDAKLSLTSSDGAIDVDNSVLLRTVVRRGRGSVNMWFRRRIRETTRADRTPFAPYSSLMVKTMGTLKRENIAKALGTSKTIDVADAGVTPAWTLLELKVLLRERGLAELDTKIFTRGSQIFGGNDEHKTLEAIGWTEDVLLLYTFIPSYEVGERVRTWSG
jgi:hypothetical protein